MLGKTLLSNILVANLVVFDWV